MKTTIDVIALNNIELAGVDFPLLDREPGARPNTLVLQPKAPLNQANSPEFQQLLEEALGQATDAVIVDFLWVVAIDSYGIDALVAGIQRATTLGKLLSFQSMSISTQMALDTAWERQQEISVGPWHDVFGEDLECFLNSDRLKAER